MEGLLPGHGIWTLIYCACAVIGLVLCSLILLLFRSCFRTARHSKRRPGPQETAVPYEHPVELYYNPYDTGSQRVRFCLVEKGVKFEAFALDAGACGRFENMEKAHIERSGCGSLPVLLHKGITVLECEHIVQYIDTTFGGTVLIPETQEAREAMVQWLQVATGDGLIEAADGKRYFSLGFAERLLTSHFREAPSVREQIRAMWMQPNPLPEYYNFVRGVFFSCFGHFYMTRGVSQQYKRHAFSSVIYQLAEINKLLADGRQYILGKFSYADISVAAALASLNLAGVVDALVFKEEGSSVSDEPKAEYPHFAAYWKRLREHKGFESAFAPPTEGPEWRHLAQKIAQFRVDVETRGLVAAYGLDVQLDGGAEEEEEM